MVPKTHFLKNAIISMSFFILMFGPYANSYAEFYYVDNAANGANNGTSWNDAWQSFANINWNNISAGDTLYISGGSSSKKYYETLTIRTSGKSGMPVVITNGEDPNHNGIAIIDGDNTRDNGIVVSNNDYIIIKDLKVQNCQQRSDGCIDVSWADFITVENCSIVNPKSRGIVFYHVNNGLIKANSCITGNVANNEYQTDGIYVQGGSNNVIDANTCIIGNLTSSAHIDPIQTFDETNLTVRNNYCELISGRSNGASQGAIIQNNLGWVKVYNNVILGSDKNKWQALLIDNSTHGGTGMIYAWNNTVIAQHPEGIACRIANSSSNQIGEIKNNACISENYYAIYIDRGVDTPSKVDNNAYETQYSFVGFCAGSKTWREWQSSGLDASGIKQNLVLDADYKPYNEFSPLVDAGTTIKDFSTDKNGDIRPYGASWDIGAYEYNNGVSKPYPPSNLRILN